MEIIKLIVEINKLSQERYRVSPSQDELAEALVQDLKRSDRLPTKEECAVMLGGSDEDEDHEREAPLHYLFPETYGCLESVWQLTPPV